MLKQGQPRNFVRPCFALAETVASGLEAANGISYVGTWGVICIEVRRVGAAAMDMAC